MRLGMTWQQAGCRAITVAKSDHRPVVACRTIPVSQYDIGRIFDIDNDVSRLDQHIAQSLTPQRIRRRQCHPEPCIG
jgi:hypothetical protein